jgi:hypothetical protein
MGIIGHEQKRLYDHVIHSAIETVLTEVFQNARTNGAHVSLQIDGFNEAYKPMLSPKIEVDPTANTEALSKDRLQQLEAELKAHVCDGMTALNDSVIDAATQIKDMECTGKHVLIIVSDGADTISKTQWKDAQAALDKVPHLQVCPVFCNDVPAQTMHGLSSASRGLVAPGFGRNSQVELNSTMRSLSGIVQAHLSSSVPPPIITDLPAPAAALVPPPAPKAIDPPRIQRQATRS